LLLSSVPIWGQNCITEAALLLRSISDFDFPTLSAYSRTPSPLPSACSLSFRSRNRDKRLGGVAVTASSVEPTIQSKNTTSSASAFRAQSRFKDLRSSPQRFARGYRAWRQAGGRIVVKMRRVRLAAGLAAQNQGRDSSRGADKASANMSSILLCLSIPRTPIRDPQRRRAVNGSAR